MSELPIKNRIYSLDILRGLVMIIMALDHTRDFFHFDAFQHDPLDVKTTSVFLYITRWVTHFCAPIFVFLAGTSIFLQGMRKSKSDLAVFLVKRGLWLIFIETVLITFAWTFEFSFPSIVLQVIWAIGISMVLMAALIRLPFTAILITGFIIVFMHNILDYVESTHHGLLWDLVRNGNFASHEILPGHKLVIIYPFVPWLGLMMLGYCFGKLYDQSINVFTRKKLLMQAGIALVIFFIVLRLTNLYGNPHPWSLQNNFIFTILSFLNLQKYPPSLLFLCITIGPALIFLSVFENINTKLTRIISVYGSVPLFYYILHFYVLHVLCMILFVSRGHSLNEDTPDIFGIPFHYMIVGEGYSLKIVYLIWIGVVILLYPFCKWFAVVKRKYQYWWLSYL